MLSVIDFERGERAKGEQAHQWGTVFQTALLLFLLVIPRLRPGLLSLRSVLSSRQNLLQTTNMEFSAGWKPVPSVSESNPGRSLGIYNHGENCCLEDSTSHRAKHPRQSDKSVFEKKLGGKTNTDLSDSTDFINGGVLAGSQYRAERE